jgi:hypothetical protein
MAISTEAIAIFAVHPISRIFMVVADQKTGSSVAHIIYRGQSYDLEELSQLSKETLLEIKSEIDTEVVRLQVQLDDPGKYSTDSDWFAKASARLRWRRRDWNMINHAINIRRQREKELRSAARSTGLTPEMRMVRQDALKQTEFERRFVDSAKIVLTEETFRRIIEMAKTKRVSE